MNLLLTTASPLAQPLADSLSTAHTIHRATPPFPHDETTDVLVEGIDALVHPIAPLTFEDEHAAVDFATRQTYNLLRALSDEGSEAGVPRVVLLSTLDLLDAYDPAYRVDERFRPLPTTEPSLLAAHLAEYTAREFAREHKLAVAVLRVGEVDEAAVAHAVERALRYLQQDDALRWSIFHLAPEVDNPRFPIEKAKSLLDYQPN